MPNETISASPTGLPNPTPDPDTSNIDAGLLAACASVLKTDAEFEAACALDEEHPDLDRLHVEWRSGSARVALIPAKTIAGVMAKLSVLAPWLPHADIERSRLQTSIVADILAL